MYKAKWQDTTRNWQFNNLQTAFTKRFNIHLTNCTIKEAFVYDNIKKQHPNFKKDIDAPRYYAVETGDYEFSCDQTLTEEQTTYINK